MGTPNQPAKPAATSATKPTAKPAQQSAKPITNETSTSPNSANAEIQPKSAVSTDTGKEPITVTNDNNGEIKTAQEHDLKKTLGDLFEQKASAIEEKHLQSENKHQESELVEDLKKEDYKKDTAMTSPIQRPTPGRVVMFYCEENDDICNNRRTKVLPATVVVSDGLISALSVHTLDSRDPIVLRKDVPHISVATRNEKGDVVGAYWD